MPRRATHNLHVPLTEDTYRQLRDESVRAQQPATTLAREAISHWLEQRRRSRLAEEIQDYAATHAGTSADLDVDLENAAMELLAREPGRRKGS